MRGGRVEQDSDIILTSSGTLICGTLLLLSPIVGFFGSDREGGRHGSSGLEVRVEAAGALLTEPIVSGMTSDFF